ncbi:hypothetical protein SSS_04959 [Sarcoptes scabiei]|nr:hypothetical protein SSS_04959 [Sarcoptes scabiei]
MMASSSQNRLMPSLSNSGDIALWLHNKLSSDDIWSDKNSIITQLNADILRNIKTCFTGLHNNVKLKLLLSFLHIAKRNVEEWSNELNNLIQIAENDSNPWVKAIAEFLLQYPQKGTINIDDSNFSEIIFYLKKCVKKQNQKILPLESLFLNRTAFSCSFGQSSQPIKHFTLKRKAKSASLRAELLQKAEDLSSGKRPSTGTTVPIRCRGLNSSDSAPLRGIPSRIYSNSPFNKSLGRSFSSGFGSSNRSGRLSSVASSGAGMKRDGGIVLLDEAPSTNQRESKRQKKDKNLASAKTSNQKIDQESSKELTTDESREDQAEKVIDHNDKELADSQPDNNPTEDKKDFTGPNKHSISKSAPDYAAGLLAGVSTSNLSDSSYDNMNNFSSRSNSNKTCLIYKHDNLFQTNQIRLLTSIQISLLTATTNLERNLCSRHLTHINHQECHSLD